MEWQTPGTQWHIKIKQYSRAWQIDYGDPQVAAEAQKLEVKYELEMTVTVLKPEITDTHRIARFQFKPPDTAPPPINEQEYILEIDLDTGRVRNLKRVTGSWDVGYFGIQKADQQWVLLTDMFGFPIDWIVQAEDISKVPAQEVDHTSWLRTKALNKRVRPAATDRSPAAIEIEAGFSPASDAVFGMVVQVWVPGESWWRSFRRYLAGRLDLEAVIVSKPR